MKNIFFLALFLLSLQLSGQCDITPLNNNSWSVIFTDSEWSSEFSGDKAIDGDMLTLWHTGQGESYPHEIHLDLGGVYPVSGLGMFPRQESPFNAKVLDHEIYLSNDGVNWTKQGEGTFQYSDNSDITLKQTTFGSIDARYVKFQGLSGFQDDFMGVAELEIYQDLVCAPTGQNNQFITFDEILDKGTEDEPFDVVASASSGLGVTFEIVSGPASVMENTVTLTGNPGIVEIKAIQTGDASYYPAEKTRFFEVIDLSLFFPEISTRLTEDHPLEMPVLKAYPLYFNSSIEISDNLIEIQQVDIEIGSDTFTAEEADGYYYYLWIPTFYGNHELSIKSVATNGNISTITRTIEVTNSTSTQTVGSLQDVVIEFGGENSRWYYGTYTLPQFVAAYSDINAFLEVECPGVPGGCDDWDRWAHVDVRGPDGNWIQLIRYITPYGVGCNHELDVTDYRSLLQGEIEFRVFIDTWGTGGWQLTLNFEYTQGTPDYTYSGVVEVWDGSYSFGNPDNLQPVDSFNATILDEVIESHLRLSNTGHAWGQNNTGNAAEFFHATHYIDVDGSETFIQDLWNTCNPNPDGCTGQQGTWYFNRAGWCPGAISPPNIYDLTPYIGSSIDLDYRFHPTYQDFCHPNNPDCISGSTCPDCNDGYNPVYFVDGHIINKSHNPIVYGNFLSANFIDNEAVYDLIVYPNPTKGVFSVYVNQNIGTSMVTVNTVEGKQVKSYYFYSANELNSYIFDLSSLSKGMYFINFQSPSGTGVKRIILE